jgi:flavin-dependent dehydrogenase
MIDVLIVGAGPAGALAALCLARRGARVLMVDRARFPRDKLCGDTLNPGALRILERHGLRRPVDAVGLPLEGMLLTSGSGVAVQGRYGRGIVGRAITRRVLDAQLVAAAVEAGVEFEDDVRVQSAVVDATSHGPRVSGVMLMHRNGRTSRVPAALTLAADGRRSSLAFGLGLARQPRAPRRWAIGAHFEGVDELSSLGEMHIRDDHYVGIAPLGGGLATACFVSPPCRGFDNPATLLDRRLAADPLVGGRFDRARRVSAVTSLGPLAVDAVAAGMPGLLLAGDAAGFIDPMTGDGLRLALRGAELAAEIAATCLEKPDTAGHLLLARRRSRVLGRKLGANWLMREVTASSRTVRAAALGARVAPGLLRAIIRYAGDVGAE